MKEKTQPTQPLAMSPPIEVVFFDFGGVLAEEGFREGLRSIAHSNGLNPEHFLKNAYEVTFQKGFVTGSIDEKTFWRLLKEHTGLQKPDSVLRNEVLSRFVLRDWMFALIEKLEKASVRRAVVSDQTNWLEELDAQHHFFKCFDRIFNSYTIGISKKESRMFDYVISEMNTRPERSLFIDDAIDNIERAKQKGLHTIFYKDKASFEQEFYRYFPLLNTN